MVGLQLCVLFVNCICSFIFLLQMLFSVWTPTLCSVFELQLFVLYLDCSCLLRVWTASVSLFLNSSWSIFFFNCNRLFSVWTASVVQFWTENVCFLFSTEAVQCPSLRLYVQCLDCNRFDFWTATVGSVYRTVPLLLYSVLHRTSSNT